MGTGNEKTWKNRKSTPIFNAERTADSGQGVPDPRDQGRVRVPAEPLLLAHPLLGCPLAR